MPNKDPGEELKKFLGPEYISYRPSGYGEEAYIEGWAAIQLANEIFGYSGWSSEIREMKIEDVEESNDKYTVSSSVRVRVTLRESGVYREDLGFGIAENIKGKGRAIKHAQKSAVTDALKRALRQFGTALGSCCYDKEYLKMIKRIKKQPREPLAEESLIRPSRSKNPSRKESPHRSAKSALSTISSSHTTATALSPISPLPNIEDISSQ